LVGIATFSCGKKRKTNRVVNHNITKKNKKNLEKKIKRLLKSVLKGDRELVDQLGELSYPVVEVSIWGNWACNRVVVTPPATFLQWEYPTFCCTREKKISQREREKEKEKERDNSSHQRMKTEENKEKRPKDTKELIDFRIARK
jgi:hypothetical protein